MEERASLQPLSASQREALAEAVKTYEAGVTRAVASALFARGIDEAVARTFRVGVVTDDPFPGHGHYRGWLAIPYLDRNDEPLSIRFRCMAEHTHRDFGHGKYMSLKDEPSRVFNIGAIHRAADEIHLTEGELDTMILTKIGLHACAVPGVANWSGKHRRMLAGFSRVWVWGDPDDSGADFNRKVTQSLRSAKAVRLRNGDVTDTYLAGGAHALHALIERN